jgi:CRISPR-associated protein Cmr4
VIDGSSLKGALVAQTPEAPWKAAALGQGGKDGGVGQLAIGDARIVALPVRYAGGGWRWVTCADVLARFARDCSRVALPCKEVTGELLKTAEALADHQALVAAVDCPGKSPCLVLEEFAFDIVKDSGVVALAEGLGRQAFADEWTQVQFAARLVVVSNTAFRHFTRIATHAVTRNALDYETKNVVEHALFREEFVQPETVFAAAVTTGRTRAARTEGKGAKTLEAFRRWVSAGETAHAVTVGGDETVGYGVCAMKFVAPSGTAPGTGGAR